MKTNEQKLELLNKFLTKNDVKYDKFRNLTYVDGHFVVNQLNLIFGNTNWSYNIKEITKTNEGPCIIKGKDGKPDKNGFDVGYICQINLIVPNLIEGGYITINDIGFGNQIDVNLGKAHEGATKEAVTDALKRSAKGLGNALGLCLYDKSFVAKEAVKTNSKEEVKAPIAERLATAQKNMDLTSDEKVKTTYTKEVKLASMAQIDILLERGYKAEDVKKLTTTEASKLISSGKKGA